MPSSMFAQIPPLHSNLCWCGCGCDTLTQQSACEHSVVAFVGVALRGHGCRGTLHCCACHKTKPHLDAHCWLALGWLKAVSTSTMARLTRSRNKCAKSREPTSTRCAMTIMAQYNTMPCLIPKSGLGLAKGVLR